MTDNNSNDSGNELLLEIRNLEIDGYSDDEWHDIIKGLDITLRRGEILGLIGESGAGKSTAGLASMNFARPGCRIKGGSIKFDGVELTDQSEEDTSNTMSQRKRLTMSQPQTTRSAGACSPPT